MVRWSGNMPRKGWHACGKELERAAGHVQLPQAAPAAPSRLCMPPALPAHGCLAPPRLGRGPPTHRLARAIVPHDECQRLVELDHLRADAVGDTYGNASGWSAAARACQGAAA